MTTTEIIASVSIISAFTSATLVTYFNYKFGVKTKKLDILFTNRLNAFKDIASKITGFKSFCAGKIAFLQGNEYSPFYNEDFGALHYRTEIAESLQANSIFLSNGSKVIVTDLLNQMSGLCNGEATLTKKPNHDLDFSEDYRRMESLSEKVIDVLYKELGLDNL